MNDQDFLRRTAILGVRDDIDRWTSMIFSVMLFIIGVAIISGVAPSPPSIEESLKPVALQLWSLIIVVSAPLGFYGRWKDHIGAEAAGYLGMALAFLVYAIAILANASLDAISSTVLVLGFAVHYGYRGYKLNNVIKELRRGGE